MKDIGKSNSQIRCLFLIAGVLSTMFLIDLIISNVRVESRWGSTATQITPKIKQYNTLGRTGLKVSDIGFGAAGTTDPSVVQYALDMGINFFDTSEYYGNGRSEETIGKVAAKYRDKMIICTKLGLDGSTKKEDVLEKFSQSLKRLQTRYCDILMIHGGNRDALENGEIHAAFQQLKNEGKIRFTGLSHHGPNIVKELRPLLTGDKFDVFLLNYDPVAEPELPEFLREATGKGIGIVAMKVFQSAKKVELEEFKSREFTFQHAAIRRVLRDKHVHTAILSMNMMDQIDEYITVSGAGNQQ